MQTFCTVIDSRYIAFAKVLWHSIHRQNPSSTLQVLIVNQPTPTATKEFHEMEGFNYVALTIILNSPTALGIYNKYAGSNHDNFRWALKPVFISWLLKNGFDKVIYLDADLFFTGNPDFLFDELDTSAVLLTPHWRNTNPFVFEDGLFSVLRDGLYNAGFIGVSKKGIPAMEWWAGLCHYKTEKVPSLGLYDDQKYLDLMPVEFENVTIVRHRGCNLASWNMDTNTRELKNGKLMILGTYEPIFIHFTKETIYHIQKGNDALLRPYLDQYFEQLSLCKWEYEYIPGKNSMLYILKKNTRIRTRIKRFFYWLAQKI